MSRFSRLVIGMSDKESGEVDRFTFEEKVKVYEDFYHGRTSRSEAEAKIGSDWEEVSQVASAGLCVNEQTMSSGSSRYSDPITEMGGWVGRGAVLYDTRPASSRPCCSQGGRCLAHVIGVYEETETGEVHYRVSDGTWTTEEWVHGDDLLGLFEPAGWSVTHTKPTYILTREHGVEDHHDLMTGRGGSGGD